MSKIRKDFMNKICAILIIFTLTVSDFLFVGLSAVTYAVDTVKTNSQNIEFSAYFLEGNGEKVQKIERNINQEESLYIDISVKNDGYFNGSIYLNNSNFKLKKEKLSENIANITENKVDLNQINAGSTITIPLKIEAIKDDLINEAMLNAQTEVSIQGQYVNSKNVEKQKYIDIKGTSNVQINWKSSEETKAELSAKLLTNSIYKVNDEEKRIVQILVNSKITDNNYPVKNTEINLSVPENVQNVEVHTRSTLATNKNINFNDKSYSYDNKQKNVTIQLLNENKNNISWSKNAEDSIVITYTLAKEQNITGNEIAINSKIQTYDNKTLQEAANVKIEKEIDGIISYELQNNENQIYKGKMYTAEEREYKQNSKIYVDYLGIANNITLKTNNSTYLAPEGEKIANITYKATKINKEEFLRIYGEQGILTIKDTNGSVLATINKDTEADENGNITVSYPANTLAIEIETSKPTSIGTLNIENTKTIGQSGYTREQINALTGIKETMNVTYNKKQYQNEQAIIELKNTSSNAKLNANITRLSTIENNENVKITAILQNSDESKDLYQNPEIRITLPKQVTKITSPKCRLLYGNGLELTKAEIVKQGENYVAVIKLSGTQNTYSSDIVEGTTIVMYANLELDKLAPNSEEKITLTYTNEIATSFADNGTQQIPVSIEGRTGLIVTNNIDELGVESIGYQGIKEVNMPIASDSKDISIKISTINNEGVDVSDVKILGEFPTAQDNTIGAALASGINTNTNTMQPKIYYTENPEATDDLNNPSNGWKPQGDINTAKKYLIQIDKLSAGEKYAASYNMTIPSNREYNMEAKQTYTASYVNTITGTPKQVDATELKMTTGAGAKVNTTVKAYVGGNEIPDGSQVNAGEIIKYEITMENTGNETAKIVDVKASVPENTTYVKYQKGEGNSGYEEDEDTENETADEQPAQDENIDEPSNDNTNTDPEEDESDDEQDISEEDQEQDSDDDYLKDDFFNEDLDIPQDDIPDDSSQDSTLNGSGVSDIYEEETLKDNTVTKTINNMEVGAKTVLTYEVKVNPQVTDGTKIQNNISVNYDQIQTNASITHTAQNAEVALTLTMLDRRSSYLDTDHSYLYLLKVDNLKDTDLSNVNLSFNGDFTVSELIVYGGNEDSTEIQDNKYTINKINAKSTIQYMLTVKPDKYQDSKAKLSVLALNKYHSNEIIENVKAQKAEITMNSSNEGDSIKAGDSINYNITVTNKGDFAIQNLCIEQQLSTILDIENVTINGKAIEKDKYTEYLGGEDIEEAKTVNYNSSLNVGEALNINVQTKVDQELVPSKDQQIRSISKAFGGEGGLLASSEEIDHILLKEEEEKEIVSKSTPDQEQEPGQGSTNNGKDVNDPQTGNIPQNGTENQQGTNSTDKKYVISGTAWYDEDENGIRDAGEKTLSGIKVTLLDLTNNAVTTATTSDSGFYSLTNVSKGKYVAMFEYDTEKYILTAYKADEAGESRNSDVENVNMNINGQEQNVASTDTLEINDQSITNIDIGLIEGKTFDLELKKTISKITVTNSAGTQVSNFNDASLAKVDIKAKELSGSTVVVEYKIKVSNTGELAGYAKNIVDYKPADLSFNSNLNPNWYQSGENIYSNSLANTKIEPGETKELSLILTKTMTETNTGLVNNTAEISEDYNSLSIKDSDSVPANKQKSEDDMGSSDLIISVKTGTAISYVAMTLSVMAVLTAIAYVLGRKIIKESIKF